MSKSVVVCYFVGILRVDLLAEGANFLLDIECFSSWMEAEGVRD